MVRNNTVFCLLILWGCSSSNDAVIADQAYYPLRVGNFQVYQVMETDFQRLTCSDNGQTIKNYQVKELVTDSAKNADGGYNYTIHRYMRADSTQAWVDLTTWTARVNMNQVIATEDNIPYVKFIFPLVNKAVWNINTYNDLKKDYDTLQNFHSPFTLQTGKEYSNTFSARRDSGEFIIYHDRRVEVYAPSIGLIYKEIQQHHYFNNSSDPCYGQQVVKTGLSYYQSLISHGHQ